MTGFDYLTGDMDGQRTLFVVPRITEDAPPEIREGITRRRQGILEGRCPCGGKRPAPTRQQRRRAARKGEALTLTLEHGPDCAAVSEATTRYVAALWEDL